MKNKSKRWLSALLALTMTCSALPLQAGAAFWDNIGSWWSPPSQEDIDKGKEALEQLTQQLKEEAEAMIKENLGELYESYKKLENSDFSAVTVDLTVKAVGLTEGSVTVTLSGGEFSTELTLSGENNWTTLESVPLFSGELSYDNEELSVPKVIDYNVTAPTLDGFEEPKVQDFILDFDWTQLTEDWKPAATATVTYSAKQPAEVPEGGDQTTLPPSVEMPAQTMEFPVVIQWMDENVPVWLRPSVIVQLLADGEPYGEPVELNLLNNWSYVWKDLPVTAVALLTTETTNSPILYGLKYEAPDGYSLTHEGGIVTARLAQDLTVPMDAAVLWEHGDNKDIPTTITLKIDESEKKIDGADRGLVWYEELGEFPLLNADGIIDYSKAVAAEPPENYYSQSLTFPWYSAGAEDMTALKDWLKSLTPSEAAEELAEMPAALADLPQTYAEGRELRWLTVVWNTYTKPYEPPQEGDSEENQTQPTTPATMTVPVDVLTIWNDRNVEEQRPATITYKLLDKEGVVKDFETISVKKSGYVSYEAEVLSAAGTKDEILALELLQSFENMHLYDREILLIPVPSSGVDVSALSIMTAEQLKNWAAQQFAVQSAEPSDSFRLLAIVINSRHAYGSLTVRKDVQDLDGYDLRDNTKFTYKISLTYPDLSSEIKTVEISEKEPLYLENLPVGTLYTVLEEGRYGYISEDIDCLQSGVIKEGSNSLTFVNRKFNLIVRMDWTNTISWLQDDVRVYVDDNKYTLGTDNLWTTMDYAYGISDLRYRDLAVRGLPEGYEEDYSIRWKNHVAIVTVSAEYDYDYEVEDDWKDTAEDDEYRVLAKVVWRGGDEENRPTVSAQLYRDGKAYRDVATLKASKNSLRDWRYVWEDVKGDEDNDWNVKLTKVPAGYSCEVTKVKDNYFIITCTWNDVKENVYTGA